MVSALAMVLGAPYAHAFGGGKGDGPGRKGVPLAERMFERHDTNKDGEMSKEEFLAGAEERFTKMDLNGDGKITKEELEQGRQKMMEERKKFMEENGSKDKPPMPPPEEE